MPYKKNADKQTPKEKVPRKRIRKEKVEKPKLKTPTVLKIKLPSLKSLLTNVKNSTAKKIPTKEIHPAVSRKIELANEVAQAQLGKPILDIKPPDAPPPSKAKSKPFKPKGRPKKTDSGSTGDNVSAGPSKPTKQKKIGTRKNLPKQNKKKNTEKDPTKPSATNIRKADSTSNTEPKRRSVRQIKKKVLKNETIEVTDEGKPSTNNAKHSPSILDVDNFQTAHNTEGTTPEVGSRKSSFSECLSWTKDISSSSTATCLTVCSNDIVKIDNKLPIVKISNIEQMHRQLNGNYSSSSDSDSSSESSSCSSRGSRISPSLNLSASSDNTKDMEIQTVNPMRQALDLICSMTKRFDLEALKWIGYKNQDDDEDNEVIEDKISKKVQLETEIYRDCQLIRNFLRPNRNKESNRQESNVANFDRSEEDHNFTSSTSKYVMFDQNCNVDDNPLQLPRVYGDAIEENFTSDKVSYMSFEEAYNDDDDALSLFAESLTGIESSKYNSTNSMCADVSDYEEYIPEPTNKEKYPVTASYIPTKIYNEDNQTFNRTKSVCEKQNADSTSINRLFENPSKDLRPYNVGNVSSPIAYSQNHLAVSSPLKKKPILLSSMHGKGMQGVKSVLFRGVCFYNLISNCKKVRCGFPHKKLDVLEISKKLTTLTNEVFIQEYMLLRNWPSLRRLYGLRYAEECIVRNLTRVLVEMNIDFISKSKLNSPEDNLLKRELLELTLLYLNNIELKSCVDLLQFEFNNRVLLCDVYMQTIAETQNFSRFKAVFIKLIKFITEIGRSFDVTVANQILERVCILPCEETIAKATLEVVKNTDASIFQNNMISTFEDQLASLDGTLFEEYRSLKERVCQFVEVPQHVNTTVQNLEVDQNVLHDQEERYTSPDTTKLDNMTKTTDEPQHPTIIRPSIFNHIFNINNTPSSESTPNNFRGKFNKWRGKRFGHFDVRHQRMGMIRHPLKRGGLQRRVTYGPTPPKFPRPGPDYF